MKNNILAWFGNALSFVVVIYLIRLSVGIQCFSMQNSLISAGTLLVVVIINLYTSLNQNN